jgi:hypothetical protein
MRLINPRSKLTWQPACHAEMVVTGQVTLSFSQVAPDRLFDRGMQESRTRENGGQTGIET